MQFPASLFILIFVTTFTLATRAHAHVTVEPQTAKANAYAKLTFRISHGCDGSPTKKITVKIPDGSLSVKPQVHPGWKVKTTKVKLNPPVLLHGKEVAGSISEVTWYGNELSDDYMDEFGISLKLPGRPGEKLVFPVIQECKKGSLLWTELPTAESGSHSHGEAKTPAPFLTLESAH